MIYRIFQKFLNEETTRFDLERTKEASTFRPQRRHVPVSSRSREVDHPKKKKNAMPNGGHFFFY